MLFPSNYLCDTRCPTVKDRSDRWQSILLCFISTQGGAKVSEMLSTTIATNSPSPKVNSASAKESPALWEVSLFPQGPLRHRKLLGQECGWQDLWKGEAAKGRGMEIPPFQSQGTDGSSAECSRSQKVCEAAKMSQAAPLSCMSLLLAASSLTGLAAGFGNSWTKNSGARG